MDTLLMRIWLREIRAPFLALSVVLVMIGGTAARHAGSFHGGTFFLTMVGVVLAHISVNLLNEYSDWRTGIDDNTVRTAFSGGSGVLQAGLLHPEQVLFAAFGCLFAAFFDGLLLTLTSGWPILALMAAGGLTVVFYSEHLSRWGLGELASGLTLGSFVVFGTYYVQTDTVTPAIIWACIPPGILTALLLLLNEFPDAEADREGGRRHLVIVLGKRRAAILYASLLAVVYGMIAAGALTRQLPQGAAIALITAPIAYRAARHTLQNCESEAGIAPAQGMNVIVVLGTDCLLAAGLLFG